MKGKFKGKLEMGGLADDAKAIAGCWFGLMTPSSDLTFGLRELKPAPRTAAALQELVERNVISVEDRPGGGVIYKPLVDCFEAFRWFRENADRPEINFRLMVPVEDRP